MRVWAAQHLQLPSPVHVASSLSSCTALGCPPSLPASDFCLPDFKLAREESDGPTLTFRLELEEPALEQGALEFQVLRKGGGWAGRGENSHVQLVMVYNTAVYLYFTSLVLRISPYECVVFLG